MEDLDEIIEGRSLYLFSQSNCLWVFLFIVVDNIKFEAVSIVFILASCVQLALDNPLNDPEGKLQVALHWLDIITTVFFTMEAVLKIIIFGFVLNGPKSYLRNLWNLMDFTIVIFSVRIIFNLILVLYIVGSIL